MKLSRPTARLAPKIAAWVAFGLGASFSAHGGHKMVQDIGNQQVNTPEDDQAAREIMVGATLLSAAGVYALRKTIASLNPL